MNAAKLKQERFWTLISTLGMFAVVYYLKMPAPWALVLISMPTIAFGWERFRELAADVSAIRRLLEERRT